MAEKKEELVQVVPGNTDVLTVKLLGMIHNTLLSLVDEVKKLNEKPQGIKKKKG